MDNQEGQILILQHFQTDLQTKAIQTCSHDSPGLHALRFWSDISPNLLELKNSLAISDASCWPPHPDAANAGCLLPMFLSEAQIEQ